MVFREAATHNYATGLDGANDEGGFRNISETKIASQGRLNSNASETNGTKSIGVWKTIAVSKGDKLSAKVWARYPTPSSTPQNRNFSGAPTLTYLGAGGVPTGSDATNPANLANWALGVSIIPNTSTSSSLPKAELKAVLYDEVGNFLPRLSKKYFWHLYQETKFGQPPLYFGIYNTITIRLG
jgi:hypothetical protein